MSELIRDLKYFWKQKIFSAGVLLTLILSYATLLLNPTVGIDDTSFKLYFIDGVAPATGRWCLYLIQKIIPLDYNPYFIETLGLLCFCGSVSLWCVVFYRILGERVSVSGYTFFAAVMLSCPLLSELVVWYLQNGIYIGYGVTALAVLVMTETMRSSRLYSKRAYFARACLWVLLLTVAIGFYESFMIVFFMGAAMVWLLIRMFGRKEFADNPFVWGANMVLSGGIALLLRTVIVKILTVLFHLEDQYHILQDKGAGYVMESVRGWFDGSRTPDEFGLVLKEFFVKYYLHAVVYLPVLILVLAVGALLLWGIYRSVRGKDFWIMAGVLAIVLIPWIMPVLEGMATYYRASQYVPLLVAFAVLAAAVEVSGIHSGVLRGVAVVLAFFLLYRQCYEMNRWLLVDAAKYEDDQRTLYAVGLELMAGYDTGKPVCVIGNRQTPESLLEDIYTPAWSKRYVLVSRMVKAVDERIFEMYDKPAGYAAAETPQLSFINWADKAFFGFDRELIRFWKMQGFSFEEDGNLDHYRQAQELMEDAPAWPRNGSIVEMEDYIIVNFGNF